MRSAILLVMLSGCSLIDAFGGQEGPWKTFERVRLPGNRSAEVIAVRGPLIAASGGPDVTFMQHRGGSSFDFGSAIDIPDGRRPATMAMAALDGLTGSPAVVVLSGQGIDVIAQEMKVFCPLSGMTDQGLALAIGDLDGDTFEDVAVLQELENRVTVFFGAGTASPLGLDCSAVFAIDVSGAGIVFAKPATGSARLFVLGNSDLVQLLPAVGNPRVLELEMLVGASNGGRHVAVGDVDGDGVLDLVHTGRLSGSEQVSVHSGAAETFTLAGTSSVSYPGGMPLDLVTFRNGNADGIVVPHEPADSESMAVFIREGGGFNVLDIKKSGYDNAPPRELFAADLDGDDIDDLVGVDVNGGDIVLALTASTP